MSDQKQPPEEAKDDLHKIGEIVEVIEEGDLVEVVDIEIYGKENRRPPRAKKYRFRIDREHFTIESRIITGEKLFELAQKSPAEYRMHQKLHGGVMKEIKVGDKVDLGEPGVERFATMKLTEGDGEQATVTEPSPPAIAAGPRRQFQLPADDQGYLNSLGLRWEAIKNEKGRWVLIHNHPLPEGYVARTVTVAIRIEGGYPPGALDMAFFLPHLARTDGKAINAISSVVIDDANYQQWSRHYVWQEDTDCLATHHLHLKNWLEAEPKR
jgi:hypothetical protein